MKLRSASAALLLSFLAFLPASPGQASTVQSTTPRVVYGDGLGSGWQDWSYGEIAIELAATTTTHAGSASVLVNYTGGWSGFMLGYGGTGLDVTAYDTFQFWVHGGAAGGQVIQVQIGTILRDITPQANTWTLVSLSLLPLGSPRSISTIAWVNSTAGSQPIFYLDDISFVTSGPVAGPALSVDVAAGQHAISPYIYGMNFATEQVAEAVRLPLRRWGGNATTRYNWQLNVHNTGADWYFENIPDADADSADSFIAQNNRTGTQTLMTVPLIGWTPRRRPPNDSHPYDCGFPATTFPVQDSFDPLDSNCGNGVRNGVNLTGSQPTDTSVAITEAFVADWVNHLTGLYGTASNRGVRFYDLDNEPGLWNDTHRDVHPQAATYDEMRDRTYAHAAALKAADPGALTLGPVEDGWCRWFFSAADQCNPGGADRAAHGGEDYVAWYLQQMRLYEQEHGVRILDYLDLHIYPQGDGIFSDAVGNAATQALRLRSTRQLWDPTYVDESWIGGTGWQGGAVQLIPRMKAWVSANYPGTGLAISEYSWGALESVNGALAQADVLGIFGREGVDVATLWGPPTDVGAPGTLAFRMYRNYDGAGASFGEMSVQAASGDQERLAVYAARRGSDGALTLMVINKTTQPLASTISLANFLPGVVAQVYRYGLENVTAIVRAADQSVTPSGFATVFPESSITLLVIPARYTLAVEKSGSGSGSVTSSPAGVSCGAVCSFAFNAGDHVTLTATPAAGSVFAGWGGMCGGSGGCTVTMSADGLVTATFKKQVLRNGGFNLYPSSSSRIPTNWAAGGFSRTDGKSTIVRQEGAASARIDGAAGKSKTLTQALSLANVAGKPFTFSFWVRGASVPFAGSCMGQVLFYRGTTLLSSQTKTLRCPGGTYGFRQQKLTFGVTGAYTRVVTRFTYAKSRGTIWLDGASLSR